MASKLRGHGDDTINDTDDGGDGGIVASVIDDDNLYICRLLCLNGHHICSLNVSS